MPLSSSPSLSPYYWKSVDLIREMSQTDLKIGNIIRSIKILGWMSNIFDCCFTNLRCIPNWPKIVHTEGKKDFSLFYPLFLSFFFIFFLLFFFLLFFFFSYSYWREEVNHEKVGLILNRFLFMHIYIWNTIGDPNLFIEDPRYFL